MSVQIAPNSAGISYSPYNWHVTSGVAVSINAGAYFRTKFSGASCTLKFDTSSMGTPASQIYYRIDGSGTFVKADVANTVVCLMPTDTAAYQFHLLEVVIKSTSETLQRWSNLQTAVKLTGLTLADGSSVVAPGVKPKNILIYGDSILEGVRTINSTSPNDTDRNDAIRGWGFELGKYLGAEVGIVGFGGQAWTGGNNGVPGLPSSYNLMYGGVSRSFVQSPDLVVINIGTNTNNTDITSIVRTFLNQLLTVVSCPIAVLRPFNGNNASYIQAAAGESDDTTRTIFINTTGMFNPVNSSDGVHPYGFTNLADIGPALAHLLNPLMYPSESSHILTQGYNLYRSSKDQDFSSAGVTTQNILSIYKIDQEGFFNYQPARPSNQFDGFKKNKDYLVICLEDTILPA